MFCGATQVEDLSIITCGPVPPNPAELLMRPEMTNLLKSLDASFDLILIDTPPVLAVTDPVVLGRIAGAVIAVVRFGVTHPAEVVAMEKALQAGGVKIAGSILNAFNPKKARGRSAYAYNGRYDYK